MGMSYTPGPWEVMVQAGKVDPCAEVVTKDFKSIGVACGCGALYDLADANLIAAAPDLLEALEVALSLIENGNFSNGVVEYGVDEGVQMTRPLISQIEAAIAKAEGRK